MKPRRLLCLLFAGAMVLAGQQPAAWLDPDRSEPAGTHYRTFHSALAKSDVSYLIYLPPEYDGPRERRYPVVYWLHGMGGNQRSGMRFVEMLDKAIRSGAASPCIAVLVNGMRDAFYLDAADGTLPVESVIVKELIPHIDATYRTLARRDARAVEGYSMGGYGAGHLGFKYPELFGRVSIMAGALVEGRGGGAPPFITRMVGSDLSLWAAASPATLLKKNLEAIRGKTMVRVMVGADDKLLPLNRAFHELLEQLEVAHEYAVVDDVAHNGQLFYQKLGERGFSFYKK